MRKKRKQSVGRSLTAVERDDEALVGKQIRELRKIRKITLQKMADAAGLSVGYLSQIERNHSKLPIRVLKRISDILGVHMNWFFQQHKSVVVERERDLIVRKPSRRKMIFTGIGISEDLLSPNLSGPLELLLSTIEPGADSGEYTHEGAEAGLVIAGILELWVNRRKFTLREGDSFSFNSTNRHRVRNSGKVNTQVVWVITPPYY